MNEAAESWVRCLVPLRRGVTCSAPVLDGQQEQHLRDFHPGQEPDWLPITVDYEALREEESSMPADLPWTAKAEAASQKTHPRHGTVMDKLGVRKDDWIARKFKVSPFVLAYIRACKGIPSCKSDTKGYRNELVARSLSSGMNDKEIAEAFGFHGWRIVHMRRYSGLPGLPQRDERHDAAIRRALRVPTYTAKVAEALGISLRQTGRLLNELEKAGVVEEYPVQVPGRHWRSGAAMLRTMSGWRLK